MVIDVGCGNGKYLDVACESNRYVLGTDCCAPLLQSAKQRSANCSSHVDVLVADALTLPIRDGIADAIVCIAVLHHLCTRQRRVEVLRELGRVLRANGRVLIYVWAQERDEMDNETMTKSSVKHGKSAMMRRRFDTSDVLVPWHLRQRKAGAESEKTLGDWDEVQMRFYHVYCRGELEDEVRDAGLVVERSWFDHQNWCVEASRRSETVRRDPIIPRR